MPLNRRMDKETCGILMQCSITQSLKKEIVKSAGILSEVFQKKKDNMVCITYMWILAVRSMITKLQFLEPQRVCIM